MKAKLIKTLVAGSFAALSTAALAGSGTSNVPVTAAVSANCLISTTTNVAFGAYDPVVANAAADLDATGVISVTCTKKAPGVTLELGNGANYAAPDRFMSANAGADSLKYKLYQPASAAPGAVCAYATEWFSGGSALSVATASWDGTAKTFNVCGRIPQAQAAAVGNYTDTVVATVNF